MFAIYFNLSQTLFSLSLIWFAFSIFQDDFGLRHNRLVVDFVIDYEQQFVPVSPKSKF